MKTLLTWKFALCQAIYTNKLLIKCMMLDLTKSLLSFIHGVPFSKDWCHKTFKEKDPMKTVSIS